LFVAGYPSATALDDLATWIERLHVGRSASDGINTRLAARELWHVTVAFLGDVADDRRDRAVAAVDAAARAASLSSPLTMRLAGGGTFGRGQFTTLWVGLGGDVAGLTSLAGTVRSQLRDARLPYDRKPLRLHLTLARPGNRLRKDQIEQDVAQLATYEGPTWPLTELALVESHLGPKPRHDIIHRAELGIT
jgi:2'-5' RNA ligase